MEFEITVNNCAETMVSEFESVSLKMILQE